jgi:hypothetical protein
MKGTVLRSFVIAGVMVCGSGWTASADQGTYQTSPIFQAGNPAMQLAGAVTLYRYKQRLEVRVANTGLNANSAYTVWWVVFNNPDACMGGCGADDLGNPAVNAAVFYAAGFVTGMDGVGNVSAYVNAGALAVGVDRVMEATGDRLEAGNGYRAEVHIVVRTHGALNPGNVHMQIGSFNGGCNPTCANQQAAIFMPVQ